MEVSGRVTFAFSPEEFSAIRFAFEKQGEHVNPLSAARRSTDGRTLLVKAADEEIIPICKAICKSEEHCGPAVPIRPSDSYLDVTVDTLQAIKNAVGQSMTIRELSNRAGVRYSCMRNLVAALAENGALTRKGLVIIDFNLPLARSIVFPEE